jgi:hypothetical protein
VSTLNSTYFLGDVDQSFACKLQVLTGVQDIDAQQPLHGLPLMTPSVVKQVLSPSSLRGETAPAMVVAYPAGSGNGKGAQLADSAPMTSGVAPNVEAEVQAAEEKAAEELESMQRAASATLPVGPKRRDAAVEPKPSDDETSVQLVSASVTLSRAADETQTEKSDASGDARRAAHISDTSTSVGLATVSLPGSQVIGAAVCLLSAALPTNGLGNVDESGACEKAALDPESAMATAAAKRSPACEEMCGQLEAEVELGGATTCKDSIVEEAKPSVVHPPPDAMELLKRKLAQIRHFNDALLLGAQLKQAKGDGLPAAAENSKVEEVVASQEPDVVAAMVTTGPTAAMEAVAMKAVAIEAVAMEAVATEEVVARQEPDVVAAMVTTAPTAATEASEVKESAVRAGPATVFSPVTHEMGAAAYLLSAASPTNEVGEMDESGVCEKAALGPEPAMAAATDDRSPAGEEVRERLEADAASVVAATCEKSNVEEAKPSSVRPPPDAMELKRKLSQIRHFDDELLLGAGLKQAKDDFIAAKAGQVEAEEVAACQEPDVVAAMATTVPTAATEASEVAAVPESAVTAGPSGPAPASPPGSQKMGAAACLLNSAPPDSEGKMNESSACEKATLGPEPAIAAATHDSSPAEEDVCEWPESEVASPFAATCEESIVEEATPSSVRPPPDKIELKRKLAQIRHFDDELLLGAELKQARGDSIAPKAGEAEVAEMVARQEPDVVAAMATTGPTAATEASEVAAVPESAE